MRRYVCIISVCMLFGFVNAQEKADLAFGVKVGLNISDFINANGSMLLVGYQTGVFGEFKFKDSFSIQPELLYSTQGAKFNDGDIILDYFIIPVMVKYYVSPSLSFEVGPQVGFLLSANKLDTDIRYLFKTTDLGLNFGTGYNFTDDFVLGLRYNLGLARLQESLANGELKYKNSVFQISMGYKFY